MVEVNGSIPFSRTLFINGGVKLKTAHQARLESGKYSNVASDLYTLECIASIERSIDRSIQIGHYEAPVDMYTKEALDHFIELEYTFRNNRDILWVSWEYLK